MNIINKIKSINLTFHQQMIYLNNNKLTNFYILKMVDKKEVLVLYQVGFIIMKEEVGVKHKRLIKEH